MNHLDILPTAAGLLLGVVNMWGSAAGALAPYVMARLTEYPEGRSREQVDKHNKRLSLSPSLGTNAKRDYFTKTGSGHA